MDSNPKTLTPKAKTIAANPLNQHQNTKHINPAPTKPTPFKGFWADKIRVTDTNTRCTLNPIPRKPIGSRLQLNGSLWEKSSVDWRRCLVGFFPGCKLSFHAMNSIANRIWKKFGLEDVTSLANGFTMFRFKTGDELQKVLESGPWMFGGKAIILQQWHSGFVFDMNKITKLPVWIRIYDLPFPLWTKEGLSEVASMVGRPLSCDDLTLGCKRLDYARLCVEVDATLPFVHTFELELCNETREVHVQYEWKPKRCEKCQVFGHSCLPSASKNAQPSQKVREDEPLVTNLGHSSQLSASKQVISDVQPSASKQAVSKVQPSATKQVISDAQPTQKVGDDKLPDTDSDESEGSDGSYDSDGSDGSYESDESDCSDGSDESSSSASDSSAKTHPKTYDVGDIRTLPLDSPLCTTSKQMSPPLSPETGSICRAPPAELSSKVSDAPLDINDDKGFTLVTGRKKKKEITTTRAPHAFTTHQWKVIGHR